MNPNSSSTRVIAWIALIAALASLAISLGTKKTGGKLDQSSVAATQVRPSTLESVRKDRVLHVGWGGFPPYTRMNPNESDPNKRVEGFMVDVVNEIAKRGEPPLRVEWSLLSWDTFRADLETRKFDFIADPVYLTVGRALDFSPSKPISYFGIAVGLARADDDRFKTFSDLDRTDITIALAEGYTSSEYARGHLTKPTFKSVPVGQDAFVQLDEVLLGRADVALNDVPTVLQYANAHKGKVKALWLDKPPAIVAGGFLARKEDHDFVEFLNNAIEVLRADGTLRKLDEKWKTFGMFPEVPLMPAKGLK
jgi:ABC-type amino acid transport substrate-binding protein